MAGGMDAVLDRAKDVCKRNGLLILSVLSVIIGCLLGFFLRTRRLSEQVSTGHSDEGAADLEEGYRWEYECRVM